jgi:hypothetical protein
VYVNHRQINNQATRPWGWMVNRFAAWQTKVFIQPPGVVTQQYFRLSNGFI